MSDHRALPWGEKHLYGMYHTVKVKIGVALRNIISNKLDEITDLSIWDAGCDKKGRQYFMIAGVLKYHDYIKFKIIKEEAQLQVLVYNMRDKAKMIKDLKHGHTIITNPPEIDGPIIEC